MRVLDIATSPLWEIPYRTATSRGAPTGVALPVVRATVDALPAGVAALLACSDLQGRAGGSPPAHPPRLLGEVLASDLQLLAAEGIVPETKRIGILLLGDLFADAGLQSRGQHGDVGQAWQAFAADFRWVAGVAGNHDVIERPPVPGHRNAHLLDGDVVTVDDLRVGGVSGIIGATKEGRAWRRGEHAFVSTLRSVLQSRPHILLLHQGPDGGAMDQPGHATIRAVLERTPALLTLCGHVHWPSPLAELPHGGQVLNVDGRAVLLQAG
jgi:Icc protein